MSGRQAILYPQPIVDQAIAELLAGGDVVLSSQINQASGVAGLDDSGHIVGPIRLRPVTYAELSALILDDDEIVVVSDTGEIFRGDGTTLGGIFVSGPPRVFVNTTASGAYSGSTIYSHQVVPVKANGVYKVTSITEHTGSKVGSDNLLWTIKNGTVATIRGISYGSYNAFTGSTSTIAIATSVTGTGSEVSTTMISGNTQNRGAYECEAIFTAASDSNLTLRSFANDATSTTFKLFKLEVQRIG